MTATAFPPATNGHKEYGHKEWHPPKCIPNWLALQMIHHKMRHPHVAKGVH